MSGSTVVTIAKGRLMFDKIIAGAVLVAVACLIVAGLLCKPKPKPAPTVNVYTFGSVVYRR